MKTLTLLAFAMIFTASCGSIKIQKAAPLPPQEPSKKGVSFGGSPVGKFEVQTGFWCEVRANSLVTFGHAGPTEAQATEFARQKCHDVYKDNPCEFVSCKPN